MRIKILPILFFLLISLKGFGQYDFRLTEAPGTFPTEAMAKVFVCTEDRSVWAVSAAGVVYYKLIDQDEFSVFTLTAGLKVIDITGYNENEMYFLAQPALPGPQVISYSDHHGILQPIARPPGVNSINDIAVVNARINPDFSSYFGTRDWLAVATDNNLYPVFRDAPLAIGSPIIASAPAKTDWRITNSGPKAMEFKYKAFGLTCSGSPANEGVFNRLAGEPVITFLAEPPVPNPSNINCTLFESPFNAIPGRSGTLYDFWGTDNGLYFKQEDQCGTRTILSDTKVSDLAEINLLRSSTNARFLLAGTDKGLYYIRSFSFQPDATLPAAEGVMMALGKVNGIATEISNGANRAPEDLSDFCEQVIWVATNVGVKKITINPINIRGDICSSFFLDSDNPRAEGSICANPFFTLCSGGVDLHLNLPADYAQRYDVKWMRAEDNYGDRVEMTQLHGRKSILVTRRGTYGVIVTSLCENIVTEIGNITIRNTPDPVITFQPPDEINVCQGGSRLLTTAPNDTYRYQWMKDGNPINGGTSNTYKVTSPGVYRVEVNNCDDHYTPSKSVKVNFLQLPEPIITRSTDKSLCYGETVRLTAPMLLGASYTWSTGETTREIEVNKSGNYFFMMTLDSDCQKVSTPTAVIVQSEIRLDHLPEIQICTMRQPNLRLTAAEGFETYKWEGQAGTANFLEVTEPGIYTLEVADAGGCKAYTTYIVVAYCPPLIPLNAFSPNGDGTNDLWKVESMENHPDAVVRVYNRYGIIVFEGNGIKPVWDGRINGENVPEGVYYYVITTKTAKPITGSVTVIR